MHFPRGLGKQASIENIDFGLSVRVHQIDAVDLQYARAANEIGKAHHFVGRGRTGFGILNPEIARRRDCNCGVADAISRAWRRIALRKKIGGRLAKVEVVLILARRGGRSCAQQVEILQTVIVIRRIAVDDFRVPQIGFMGPRAKPEVFQQCRAGHVGKRIAFNIDAGAHDLTAVFELASWRENAGRPGRPAAARRGRWVVPRWKGGGRPPAVASANAKYSGEKRKPCRASL